MVASCPVTAVRFAGGWLFDQVLAGWEATVFLADRGDPRPLRILGGHPENLEVGLAVAGTGPRPRTIAVEAAVYAADARVRDLVRDVLWDGAVHVQFWGDGWPDDLAGGRPVQHQLSVAARAFKANALGAAAVAGETVSGVETFRTGGRLRVRSAPDLVPAG